MLTTLSILTLFTLGMCHQQQKFPGTDNQQQVYHEKDRNIPHQATGNAEYQQPNQGNLNQANQNLPNQGNQYQQNTGEQQQAGNAHVNVNQGQNHGQNAGQNQGQNHGQNQGQNHGQNQGQNHGQNQGQNHGQNQEVPEGYWDGEAQRPAFNDPDHVRAESDHVKEHLKDQIDVDSMTPEQQQFYYFKMHDYDDNNQLDGLEIVKALTHVHEEYSDKGEQQGAKTLPKVEDDALGQAVDTVLQANDFNDDGFIDYSEFLLAMKGERPDNATAGGGPGDAGQAV